MKQKRKYTFPKVDRKTISLTVDKELFKTAKLIAKKDKITFSRMVDKSIILYFDKTLQKIKADEKIKLLESDYLELNNEGDLKNK